MEYCWLFNVQIRVLVIIDDLIVLSSLTPVNILFDTIQGTIRAFRKILTCLFKKPFYVVTLYVL